MRKTKAKKEIKATKNQKKKEKKGKNEKLLRKMIRLKHLKIEEEYSKT